MVYEQELSSVARIMPPCVVSFPHVSASASPWCVPFLMGHKMPFSSAAGSWPLWLNVLCQVSFPSPRPFYIEPTNIVSVNDVTQRASDCASAMNKRIHYYSRLSACADRALVRLAGRWLSEVGLHEQ